MRTPLGDLVYRLQRSIAGIGSNDHLPNTTVDALDDLGRALDEDDTQDGMVVDELTETVRSLRRTTMRQDSDIMVVLLANLLDILVGLHRRGGHAETALPLAEEHLAIRRSRAATSSDPRHHVSYARALAEHSRTLYLLNRRHEALASAQEAVAQLRQAAAAGRPVQHELADHLSQLQNCLWSVDRFDEALAVAQEAVTVETQVRLADPTGDPSRLANALTDLSFRLAQLDRYPAAAAAVREAAGHLRQLVTEGSSDAQYRLADALTKLRYYASRADQWPESVAAAREEVAIRRQLPARAATRDAIKLAHALRALASTLAQGRQFGEVAQIAGEAIVRYRQLAAVGLLDTVDLGDFAIAVDLVRDRLVATGQDHAAHAPAHEQVALYRRLAHERPDWHLNNLAIALDDLADALAATGNHSGAAAARAEAASIRSTTPR